MNPSPNYWLYVVVTALVLLILFLNVPIVRTPVTEVSYSEFKEFVAQRQVDEVTLRGREVTATLKVPLAAGAAETKTQTVRTQIPTFAGQDLTPLLEQQDVEIRAVPEEPRGIARAFYFIVSCLILIGVYWPIWRRMWRSMVGGLGGRNVDSFLYGPARKESEGRVKVTFADVAGQEHAKCEVAELVDFLRDAAKYTHERSSGFSADATKDVPERALEYRRIVDRLEDEFSAHLSSDPRVGTRGQPGG